MKDFFEKRRMSYDFLNSTVDCRLSTVHCRLSIDCCTDKIVRSRARPHATRVSYRESGIGSRE